MAKDMSSGVLEAPARGYYMRCSKGELLLLLDTNSQSQQDATKVIKKVEAQNLSRNELTFGNEQDELVVKKGLKWKAISTFR